MSYNITNWKTKELKDFRIPLASFFKHEREDFNPKQYITLGKGNEPAITLECGGGQVITGKLIDNMIHVTGMDMSGEGSGSFKMYVLDEAFRASQGYLKAVLIWEGGDTISNLVVSDGEILEIEL